MYFIKKSSYNMTKKILINSLDITFVDDIIIA